MNQTSERGFLKLIILIVIGLVILGYFGLNIQDILAKPVVHDNLVYFWDVLKTIWNNYLIGPATWVWDHIIKFFWELFLDGINGLRDGQTSSDLMQ